MATTDFVIDFHREQVNKSIKRTVIELVAPALKTAVEQAAQVVAAEYGDGHVVRYAAQTLILEELAALLTLSDVSELDVLQPAMMAPEYIRELVDPFGEITSEAK